MGRPEILLAVPEGSTRGVLEKVLDVITDGREHRLEMPPLRYSCLEEIDEKLEPRSCGALFDTMVIVLLPELESWAKFSERPLTTNSESNRSPLLELVLQYPEIYWVFIRHPDAEDGEGYKNLLEIQQVSWKDHFVESDRKGLESLACLVKRHGNGFRTLFDPTGLRAGARWYLLEEETKRGQPVSVNALSVEDEASFALFNGYALFRRGFSTYLASTLKETRRLLRDPSLRFTAVIEDLFLNFHDGERTTLRAEGMLPMDKERPEELLERRMAAFPMLAKGSDSFCHLVISAGVPEHAIENVVWTTKPYGGIFAKEIEEANDRILRLSLGGRQAGNGVEAGRPHGMPGALHALAEDLVRRAGEALSERAMGASAAAAVHAAVLALEARRCLADSRSSLALTALNLQHKAEVIADCMFIGTLTDLNAGERLRDLKKSVEHILGAGEVGSNTAAKYEIQKLDAMMHIATELSSIYDACGQFDEAELLRRAVLKYQLDIQVARSVPLYELVSEIRQDWHDNRPAEGSQGDSTKESWREDELHCAEGVLGLIALPAIGFKYYIGALLRSGRQITGACLLWIFLFGVVYTIGAPGPVFLKNATQSLLVSGFFFVSGNAPPVLGPATTPTLFFGGVTGQFVYQVVVFLNCLCGFVHLGVFIAYLYSKVARK